MSQQKPLKEIVEISSSLDQQCNFLISTVKQWRWLGIWPNTNYLEVALKHVKHVHDKRT